SRSLWRSDHIFTSTRGVRHMASEDSVDDNFQRPLSLLAFVIHRICKLHDRDQSLRRAMESSLEHLDCLEISGDVGLAGRVLHVSLQERNDLLRNRTPRRDGVYQNVRVARLRMNRSRLKEISELLEKVSSVPMLVDKKLRINIETRLRGRMALDRD